MPLFFQHTINGSAKIGVWYIEENENFFLQKVSLQKEITHWHKRLQHLAGRYLLQELYPDFPHHLIEIAGTRKPYLPNEEYHFSISHCGDYAAVIISETSQVGIDIELVTDKVEKVKHKFLNNKELKMNEGFRLANDEIDHQKFLTMLTLCWCCKEAVFKWFALGGLDFRNDINLVKASLNNTGIIDCEFTKKEDLLLNINYKIAANLCLAWIIQ